MIHAHESVRATSAAQDGEAPRARRPVRLPGIGVLLGLILWGISACDGGPIQPDLLRKGQLGSITIGLEAPLGIQGEGRLTQVLSWASSGGWRLDEAISYQGTLGDANTLRSSGDPRLFAAGYATIIDEINKVGGPVELFTFGLYPDTVPPGPCGKTRTTLNLAIRDEARDTTYSWTRCVDGSLATITQANAGPDEKASRLAQVALDAREFTVGNGFASVYAGSVPFATLDRGDDLATADRVPVAFTDSVQFRSFWGQAGGGRALPAVDFSQQMVILGVVGQREEAGDSVEVRKILQVDQGTLIEIWERVPGNFCSPVARRHVPYHLVVAPRTPAPLRFSDIRHQEVPCG